jgi:hypothetical protein
LSDASTAAEALDPDRLIAEAEAVVDSSDWGEPPFRDALEILCRSAVDELNAPQMLALKDKIEPRLVQRLQMMRDRRTYPEIARQEIRDPLVVTGLPRAGTTVLHAVLSRDPRVRSPLKWEVAAPSPPPQADFRDDPRFLASEAAMAKIDPALLAMHTMAADLPEEDQMLFEWAGRSHNLCVRGYLPDYMRWLLNEADMRPAYEFHRQALQHMQAFAPRTFWSLKTPLHMHWLDELFATYPEARIIVMHRDPAQVLPSLSSLTYYGRASLAPADPHAIGRELFDEFSLATDRLMAFRDRGAHSDRFIDVNHVDFVRAPMEVIQRVYDKFGIDLTDEARSAMSSFMADNRSGRHGKHSYTLEEFGLSKGAIRERFRRYIETYTVPLGD